MIPIIDAFFSATDSADGRGGHVSATGSHHPYGADDDGSLPKINGEKLPSCSHICDASWGPIYRRVATTMEYVAQSRE
jgi:hypothetical protein